MRISFAAALLTVSCIASAQGVERPKHFLVPGDYHDGEAPAALGKGWLALVPAGARWQLVPARTRIERIHDPVMDANGQKTGIGLRAQDGAIALLRLPGLRTGAVDMPDTRLGQLRQPLSIEVPIDIDFKGTRYHVSVRENGAYLVKGTSSAPLDDIVVGGADSDDAGSLLWAGDLDRDGKLDLLVAYGGSNSYGVCLYLSTGAPRQALVRRVACHGGVGC